MAGKSPVSSSTNTGEGNDGPDGGVLSGRPALSLLPFLLGLTTQIGQLLILREVLILSSGSETALAFCFAAWALLNGAGALLGAAGGRIGLPVGACFRPLLAILPFLLAGSIHLARVARSFVDVGQGQDLPFSLYLILLVLVVAPVSAVDGFLFVSGLRFLFGRSGGRGSAFVYGVESLGSLAGGLLFSFVLVFLLDPFSICGLLALLSGLFLFCSPGDGSSPPSRLRRPFRILLLATGLAGLFSGAVLNSLSETERWKVLQPAMELKETKESPYQHLALLELDGMPAVFANGKILFSSLRVDRDGEPGDRIFPHFAMLQHRLPERVLCVGGGPRGLLTDLLAHDPERVDWVEYDRELLALTAPAVVREDRDAWDHGRVRRHLTDGRFFIRNAPPRTYDLILLDVPDPSNANANRFYTAEFFGSCKRVLRSGGVLAFQISSQPNFIGEEMLQRNGSILRALSESFPCRLVTPGETAIVVASGKESTITASFEELVKRYEERGVRAEPFSPYLFYGCTEEFALEQVRSRFQEAIEKGGVEVNRDDFPVAYFKDHLLWLRMIGSGETPKGWRFAGEWLTGSRGRKAAALWIPAAFPLLGILLFIAVFVSRRRTRTAACMIRAHFFLTAAAVGFGGITLEIGLLLSFQNVVGYLYSQMGLVIAAYMAGLTLGSLLPLERQWRKAPFALSCLLTALGVPAALGLPRFADCIGAESFVLLTFAAVTVLLGAAGGLAFRGTALALERDGKSPGGVIYAVDILGTALGGLLAGSFLIPMAGLSSTFLVAGGITFLLPLISLAFLSLVLDGRDRLF